MSVLQTNQTYGYLWNNVKMSDFSGFDSEAVGFDSITLERRHETTSSTQTTEFDETSASCQTNTSKDCGSTACPEELTAKDDVLKEYQPPGLNEFLQRVVPGMLEQLEQNNKDTYNSSDSDEDDVILAKLVQEIKACDVQGGGDQPSSILALSWSSAGNSLAVSIGTNQHENWCTHNGVIRIYTIKFSAGDKLVHNMDIREKNCVSVVKYHPTVSALLAYGTISGEVVICNLSNPVGDMQLTSPAGCHGCRRVSFIQWADASLANTFLVMQIKNKVIRRATSDQILISSGSDGSLNVWQVNSTLKVFENVVTYAINGSRKMSAPDITCFDFIKAFPLRPCEEKVADDIFVVGTKTGSLFLCNIRNGRAIVDGNALDPVYEVLDGHSTCVLAVAFSFQKPGLFSSISIDSELRLYDIKQTSPLKVFILDVPVTCMSWLPNSPCVAVAGVSGPNGPLRVYNTRSGSPVRLEGLSGDKGKFVTSLDVNQSGACRVAAGDSEGGVRVWELPSRRIRLTAEDLDF